MTDNPHFLDKLLNEIEKNVENYTQIVYGQLVDTLGPVLMALVGLYIVSQGIRLLLGHSQHTPLSYVRQTTLLTFIVMLAMHWDWFSILIVDTVMHTPDALIGALIPNSDSSEQGVTGFFTLFFDSSIEVFIKIFKEAGLTNFSSYLIALIGIIAVLLLVVAIFVLLVMAEIFLSILLALAPFVIPMYLFESSKFICMSWARMLISTMFVPILVYSISGLFISILEKQLETIQQDDVDLYSVATYAVTVIICVLLMRQVPALASGIGSGVTYANGQTVSESALKWGSKYIGMGTGYLGGKLYDYTMGRFTQKMSQSAGNKTRDVAQAEPEPASSIIILPSSLSGYGNRS